MKNPADFDTPVPMGIGATTRRDQFAVMQRTFRAQLGSVILRVPEDIPHRNRQLLQKFWSDHIIGVTGDGELRGQRDPDTTDHDCQMQLPAVPPAVIPGLTPSGFGVNRSMRDRTCQPMLLVPEAAGGTQWGIVDSRC